MNNNYVLFYKTNKDSFRKSKRPDLPVEQWEEYCKKQGYKEYDIQDLRTYDAWQLHLTTSIVYFNRKYYLPDEIIPYPKRKYKDVGQFEIDCSVDKEFINDEEAFDEIYNYIEDELWTLMVTEIKLPFKKLKLAIVAQFAVKCLPKFLEKLISNKYAVYENEEYSSFKWLAWIKDDKVRIIHQNYCNEKARIDFNVLVDKSWFYATIRDLVNKAKEFANNDLEGCNQYLMKKYGRLRIYEIGSKDHIESIKKKYIKTDLANKLYSKLKELWDDDNFDTGVVVGCETDENIQKMLDFIETKPTKKEILFYSNELDKK